MEAVIGTHILSENLADGQHELDWDEEGIQ